MGLLSSVDEELERRIVLVAVGGTAMTLLDLKPSTIDIDFTGPYDDIREFNRIQKRGLKVSSMRETRKSTRLTCSTC